jgi:hypothetical protein
MCQQTVLLEPTEHSIEGNHVAAHILDFGIGQITRRRREAAGRGLRPIPRCTGFSARLGAITLLSRRPGRASIPDAVVRKSADRVEVGSPRRRDAARVDSRRRDDGTVLDLHVWFGAMRRACGP